jgi:hypothetical protein
MRNCDFFCVNIHVPEKAVWKRRYISYRDSSCVEKELCLESLYSQWEVPIDGLLTLNASRLIAL